MQTHAYHLCDPGPLILAPFVNDFYFYIIPEAVIDGG